MENIISLAKRRGFIYQGSEIYGGLAGTWDWGPLGVEMKNNVRDLWWQRFVRERDDMYGIDAAILMNAKVWEAAGHVSGFSDSLVECEKCKRRFRADHLEDRTKCSECGGNLGKERQFNMMFKTSFGAVEDSSSVSYLRPETAQGMFVNFKNIIDSFHPKLPFGMAQIGKAFRNEITPRDFLFRTREFEQMEVEYFVKEADWEKHFEYWRMEMKKWIADIGLSDGNVHEIEVSAEDRAHYSQRTVDFEYDFPFGRGELYGLAYRGDFDLKNHMEASKVDLRYFDEASGERFLPHVIEPTFGMERTILALLAEAYTEDEMGEGKRVYLKLNPRIAPVKAAVFPLMKNKPELVERAREIYGMLKKEIPQVMWDDNGNVGKRYRRQDEIGTPYCITVDFQTLEDGTVTLRDRDSGEQERMAVEDLTNHIKDTIK
ncbi:MAG: glycine--tRNA ligase [Patescibacteria group bacterium]|nr:MAG: glycine--tRNA ligase [Patescibacteria group bacterium]